MQDIHLDIYICILRQLDVSRYTDDSVKTLVNCSEANSGLRAAAVLSLVWEPHYKARYRYCDADREAKRTEDSNGNRRLMFEQRRRLDRSALLLMDEIVREWIGRGKRADLLVCTYGLDILDTLELEAQRPVPHPFQEKNIYFVGMPQTTNRRYWVKQILGLITKRHAIMLWGRLRNSEDEASISFEEAVSALSGFFGHPVQKISDQLDDLCLRCREYLASGNRTVIGDSSYDQLADACRYICEFMQFRGFYAAETTHPYFLDQFPHGILSTNKYTSPLSLAFVFIGLARRHGLAARLVTFPGKTIAEVRSVNSEISPVYVDVNTDQQHILSPSEDMPRILASTGKDPSSLSRYLSPLQTSKLLFMITSNIIVSHQILHTMGGLRHVDERDAECSFFAVSCVHAILSGNFQLLAAHVERGQGHPLDCTIIRSVLAPFLPEFGRAILEKSCEVALREYESHIVRSRSTVQVRFFVGMVFQHIKYEYIACIIDWQPTCTASEDWITEMGVDDLARGRNQPFYTAVGCDSQTYVAEENVKPINPTEEIVVGLFNSNECMEALFEGADLRQNRYGDPARGRMLLSPDTRKMFPDDDQVGADWVEGRVEL